MFIKVNNKDRRQNDAMLKSSIKLLCNSVFSVNPHIQFECGKYRPEKTSYHLCNYFVYSVDIGATCFYIFSEESENYGSEEVSTLSSKKKKERNHLSKKLKNFGSSFVLLLLT